MALSNETVLVSLNIGFWAAQKFDKKVSAQTTEKNNAAEDAGRFNKHLLHKDALCSIQEIIGQARRYHARAALDWEESKGQRVLPSKKIMEYTETMRGYRQQFNTACETFFKHYPKYVAHAAERLGDMFNIEDFPPIEEVRTRYSFKTSISPIPTAGDFRVDIPNNQLKEIQADMQKRMDAAEKTATQDLWNRTHKVLNTLYEALSAPNGKLYETTINTNITDLLTQINALNFTDDPELTETAYFVPMYCANSSSNLATLSPPTNDSFRNA